MNEATSPPGTELSPDSTVSPRTSTKRILAASMLGTTVEWYDFFIYGTAAALVFSEVFFPHSDSATGTLVAFATFGAGFVVRPLGAVVIGHLGDKYGRKPMLMATVLLMGGATVAIGLLPSYAAVGVWAPSLLVLLRLLQGFAVGGEWGGAALMAVEHAPAHRRALYGAFTQAAVPLAYILSAGVFLAVEGALTHDALLAWGWRVPFLLSIVVIGIAVLVRSGVAESPTFVTGRDRPERLPLIQVLTRYPRTVLFTVGAVMATSTESYLNQIFLLSYATTQVGVSAQSMLVVTVICSAVTIGLVLGAGRAADRFGGRSVAMIGAVGLALLAFPTFAVVNTGSFAGILAIRLVGCVFSAALYAPIAAILASSFSVRVRYTGVSLGYQVAAILGGGFAPLIAQALLTATGTWTAVAGYFVGVCVVSVICLALLGTAAKENGGPPAVSAVTP